MTTSTHFVGRIVVTRVTKTEEPAKANYGKTIPATSTRDVVEELDVTVKGATLEVLTTKLVHATELLEEFNTLDADTPPNTGNNCLGGC